MKTTILHGVAAATVIAGAASSAYALDAYFDITRPGPDERPPYTCIYKYKVKKSDAKGTEKYHMSVGDVFVSDFGVSCSGSLEASKHDRSPFFFGLLAPIGNGTVRETSFKSNFDSRRGSIAGTALDRDEFGFTLQNLDADLGGGAVVEMIAKRPPVPVNGLFQVDRLKVKGKVRTSRGRLSGTLKFQGTGVVTSGPNQGKAFKALLKTRIKDAEELLP